MNESDIKLLFDTEVYEKNVKQYSPQWWSIKFKYDMMLAGSAAEEDAKRRLIRSTVTMITNFKKLQVSSFNGASSAQVMEIYGATAALYTVLEKHNLTIKQ